VADLIDRERVTALLAADPYAQGLGVRLVEVGTNTITVAMTVTEAFTNFHGGMHGGALFSLADCVFSLASNAQGSRAVAIDAHIVFSAAIKVGDELAAEVEEVHRGRTLATYRVLVRRQDGRVAGHFTGTVFIAT
jgi:acyl-CoA thioesterase